MHAESYRRVNSVEQKYLRGHAILGLNNLKVYSANYESSDVILRKISKYFLMKTNLMQHDGQVIL